MIILAYVAGYLYLALGLVLLTEGPLRNLLSGLDSKYQATQGESGWGLWLASCGVSVWMAPSVVISWIDTFGTQNHLGVGTILGRAIFNLWVMVAAGTWAASEPLQIHSATVRRDLVFSLLAVGVLALTWLDGSNTPWNMWTLITVQLVYLGRLGWDTYRTQHQQDWQTYYRVQHARTWGTLAQASLAMVRWRRPRATRATQVPLPEPPTQTQPQLVIPVPRTPATVPEPPPRDCPSQCLDTLGCGLRCLTVGVWDTCFSCTTPVLTGQTGPLVLGYLAVTTWTVLLTSGLVWFATELGIQEFWTGLVLLAPTVSLSDLVIVIRAVREGHGHLAVADAMASNIFDISVGLGSANLVYTVIYGNQPNRPGQGGYDSLGAVAVSVVLIHLILSIHQYRLHRLTGTLFGIVYLGWAVVTTINRT